MEEKNTTLSAAPDCQPDAAFTQLVDGRLYRVRVFFPKDCAKTLQQLTESMIWKELMKSIERITA